jgi:hypothetical protein
MPDEKWKATRYELRMRYLRGTIEPTSDSGDEWRCMVEAVRGTPATEQRLQLRREFKFGEDSAKEWVESAMKEVGAHNA